MPLSNIVRFIQENPVTYLITSKILLNAWVIYLNMRQLAMMSEITAVPDNMRDSYPETQLRMAMAYQFEKIMLSILHKMYDTFVFFAEILGGAIPLIWRAADYLGDGDESKAGYFVALSTVFETVVYLPLNFIDVFVIEQRYGFNKQAIESFISEAVAEVIAKCIIAIPVVWGIIKIMRWKPETYQYHLMAFIFLCRTVLILVYLEFLFPLLSNFKPLPEGHLKDSIKDLADTVHFPLYDIYVMEASQSTTHGNAFFIGLGSKKMIVFYDTMLEGYLENSSNRSKRYSESELLGILAHEMGHWSKHHITKALMIFQLITCLEIWLCSEIARSENVDNSVGFTNSNQVPRYIEFLIIAPLFLVPLEVMVTYTSHYMSRYFEYEADVFSASLGQKTGLISGLKKVSSESLKLPMTDSWYSAWYDTHPSLDQRLKNINRH